MGQGNKRQPEHGIDVITEFHEDFDRALAALRRTTKNSSEESLKITLITAMISRSRLKMILVPEPTP